MSIIWPDVREAEWMLCNLAKVEARWPSAPLSHLLSSLDMILSNQKVQSAASLFSFYHKAHSFVCHLISSEFPVLTFNILSKYTAVKQKWTAPRAVSICLDTEVTMGCRVNRQSHLCQPVPGGGKLYRLGQCRHSSLSHLISGRYDENGHCLMSNLNISKSLTFTIYITYFTIKPGLSLNLVTHQR